MGAETVNTSVAVTIAIFCLGVVYQCGRLSARVEAIEVWRARMENALDGLHTGIRRIEDLVKEGR